MGGYEKSRVGDPFCATLLRSGLPLRKGGDGETAHMVEKLFTCLAFLVVSLLPASSSGFSLASSSTSMATVTTTAGPCALRSLVQEASIGSQKQSLDLGGIVW